MAICASVGPRTSSPNSKRDPSSLRPRPRRDHPTEIGIDDARADLRSAASGFFFMVVASEAWNTERVQRSESFESLQDHSWLSCVDAPAGAADLEGSPEGHADASGPTGPRGREQIGCETHFGSGYARGRT